VILVFPQQMETRRNLWEWTWHVDRKCNWGDFAQCISLPPDRQIDGRVFMEL